MKGFHAIVIWISNSDFREFPFLTHFRQQLLDFVGEKKWKFESGYLCEPLEKRLKLLPFAAAFNSAAVGRPMSLERPITAASEDSLSLFFGPDKKNEVEVGFGSVKVVTDDGCLRIPFGGGGEITEIFVVPSSPEELLLLSDWESEEPKNKKKILYKLKLRLLNLQKLVFSQKKNHILPKHPVSSFLTDKFKKGFASMYEFS